MLTCSDSEPSIPEKCVMPDNLDYMAVTLRGKRVLAHFPYSGAMQVYQHGKWTKKQKKAHARVLSGFELAYSLKDRISFLTLSTQYDVLKINGVAVKDREGRSIPLYPRKRQQKINGMNLAFTKLKQMIERKVQQIMYWRYCKRCQKEPYEFRGRFKRKSIKYPSIYARFKFKLKYFKVKTDEGGGVMHIVFRKPYKAPSIPYFWLKQAWFKLWGAKNGVNIKSVPITDADKLSKYMVGQYFVKQPIIRMSYSPYWSCNHFHKRMLDLMDKVKTKRKPGTAPLYKPFSENKPKPANSFSRMCQLWGYMMRHNKLPTGSTGHQRRFSREKPFAWVVNGVACGSFGIQRKYPKRCYVKQIVTDQYGIECEKTVILPEKTQGVGGVKKGFSNRLYTLLEGENPDNFRNMPKGAILQQTRFNISHYSDGTTGLTFSRELGMRYVIS